MVTLKELGISSAYVRELVVPADVDIQGSGGLLHFATRASSASWGDWVVHMGSDALLNVRAVDAVLAHCARETRLAALSGRGDTHVRRLAQGAVLPGITRTSNSFIDGVQSVFQWIPAMAECIRAGESYGALRMMYAKHSRVVAPIPNTYLVVLNELELAVGFKDMAVHDGFEAHRVCAEVLKQRSEIFMVGCRRSRSHREQHLEAFQAPCARSSQCPGIDAR